MSKYWIYFIVFFLLILYLNYFYSSASMNIEKYFRIGLLRKTRIKMAEFILFAHWIFYFCGSHIPSTNLKIPFYLNSIMSIKYTYTYTICEKYYHEAATAPYYCKQYYHYFCYCFPFAWSMKKL